MSVRSKCGILRNKRKRRTSIHFNAEIDEFWSCCSKLHILCESAQYVRSSCFLVLPITARREDEEAGNPLTSWRLCKQRIDEQRGQQHEVSSLVSTPRLVEAPGNRLTKEMKTYRLTCLFHSQLSSCYVIWYHGEKLNQNDFCSTKSS